MRHLYQRLVTADPAAIRRHTAAIHLLTTTYTEAPTLNARPPLSQGEVLRLTCDLPKLLYAWAANDNTDTVAFLHTHHATTIDQRLIEALLRRIPPDVVLLIACTPTDTVPTALRHALTTATRRDLRPHQPRQPPTTGPQHTRKHHTTRHLNHLPTPTQRHHHWHR